MPANQSFIDRLRTSPSRRSHLVERNARQLKDHLLDLKRCSLGDACDFAERADAAPRGTIPDKVTSSRPNPGLAVRMIYVTEKRDPLRPFRMCWRNRTSVTATAGTSSSERPMSPIPTRPRVIAPSLSLDSPKHRKSDISKQSCRLRRRPFVILPRSKAVVLPSASVLSPARARTDARDLLRCRSVSPRKGHPFRAVLSGSEAVREQQYWICALVGGLVCDDRWRQITRHPAVAIGKLSAVAPVLLAGLHLELIIGRLHRGDSRPCEGTSRCRAAA